MKSKIDLILDKANYERKTSDKPKLINKSKKVRTSKSSWVEVPNKRICVRSSWERNFVFYLQWLKDRGDIIDFHYEMKTFYFGAIKRGCVSYKPDFYIEAVSGNYWIELKGFLDNKSKTKLKRFAKYFPDEKLILWDSTMYKDLKNNLSRIIPNWGS